MSLTRQDLGAIQKLIEASEGRLMTRIDDLDDVLSMQMEHGLQEVRDQLTATNGQLSHVSREVSSIKETVSRIERVQQAELERNDRQDEAIKQLRKNLHAV